MPGVVFGTCERLLLLLLLCLETQGEQIFATEEPGGLQSMGSQRVIHNCVTNIFNTTLN